MSVLSSSNTWKYIALEHSHKAKYNYLQIIKKHPILFQIKVQNKTQNYEWFQWALLSATRKIVTWCIKTTTSNTVNNIFNTSINFAAFCF